MAGKPDFNEEEATALHEEISAAFCALAELYLTDLWYPTWPVGSALRVPRPSALAPCSEEDDAANYCVSFMEKALEYDPANIEALQARRWPLAKRPRTACGP
jgi:hypothetical protein